jgi:hypothetical protein
MRSLTTSIGTAAKTEAAIQFAAPKYGLTLVLSPRRTLAAQSKISPHFSTAHRGRNEPFQKYLWHLLMGHRSGWRRRVVVSAEHNLLSADYTACGHRQYLGLQDALFLGNAGQVILDNLGVHHCKPVKAWLAENKHRMEVFCLPSYSPELNPEERLNADLKHVIRAKVPVRTKPKLQAAAVDHMNTIANSPERVKAYFQDAFVKYAA